MRYPSKTLKQKAYGCLAFLVLAFSSPAQPLSFDNLLNVASLSPSKVDGYIVKRNFYQTGKSSSSDTITYYYSFAKPAPKKNRQTDSTERRLYRSVFNDEFSVTYQTTSYAEFIKMETDMKRDGFYCNEEVDSSSLPSLLYQKGAVTVSRFTRVADSLNFYCLTACEKIFPGPGQISFADDLIMFTSHEYLEYYFGAPNVKKDIFYLAGNDMVRCSVLFSNSPRQVVFIWADEINRTGIANLLFGGQQRLKSAMETSNFVAESNWLLKSGLHAGMTLYELRMLNESNFQFYGGNSVNAGAIVPGNKGKLDFKKEDIILGCVNCKDNQFYSSAVLDADEALEDGRIVFVLSIILNPASGSLAAKMN